MEGISEEDLRRSQELKDGLKIHSMRLSSGRKDLWKSDWSNLDPFQEDEIVIKVPAKILKEKVVSREITFSTKHLMKNFRIIQTVNLNGEPIENWLFEFGFCIDDSTNTWQSTVEAGKRVLDPKQISGLITIETSFFDGDLFIASNVSRVYYV